MGHISLLAAIYPKLIYQHIQVVGYVGALTEVCTFVPCNHRLSNAMDILSVDNT